MSDSTTARTSAGESEPEDAVPDRSPAMTAGLLGLGVLLGGLTYVALLGADLSPGGRVVAALGVLMAVWWMTEAIPLAATALLPLVVIPALTGLSIDDSAAPYADPIVFLFLGGFLIAIAMQKWNLHRRIALLTLQRVGTSPRRIVLGMMIATAFLSMWVSNTATTLMMLPIALSVLTLVIDNSAADEADDAGKRIRDGAAVRDVISDPDVRVFGVALVLSVAWAASIGGLGTLLGSPPNAIVAGYLASELDKPVGFVEWMMLGVPLVVVFLLIAWLLITRVLYRFALDSLPGGAELIDRQLSELGPMTRGEKSVLAVFAAAAFFWIVPGILANSETLVAAVPALDQLDDTAIAIAAGVALFLIPGDSDGRRLLAWQDAERGLPWGVLLLFGGGLSLAAAVSGTGLDKWFGQQVQGLEALPVAAILAAVVVIVLLLTEMTSNTATAATFVPVLGGVAMGIGVDAPTLLIPAALAATCAFMLPVGTPPNAIVFGSGAVTITEMARGGAVLNVVGVVLITVFTVAIGPFALGLML